MYLWLHSVLATQFCSRDCPHWRCWWMTSLSRLSRSNMWMESTILRFNLRSFLSPKWKHFKYSVLVYSFNCSLSTVVSKINRFCSIWIRVFPCRVIVITGWPFCFVHDVIILVKSKSLSLSTFCASYILIE